ncbi:hypothetical protein ACSZNH_12140 [Aeromonas dhakensis]|uniref:hypothetical protein n=1 Tax=Aeromonas dhakensis TaxID=196024 RepID=UPI003EC7095A
MTQFVGDEVTAIENAQAGVHDGFIQPGAAQLDDMGPGLGNAEGGAVGRSEDMDSTMSATVRMRASSRICSPLSPAG